MEFWVAVLVIAFVVREMFTSRYRSQLDERFATITNRLRRMESEVDALRADARLVPKADVRPADAIPRSVTTEPLANARVIVVDAPPPGRAIAS